MAGRRDKTMQDNILQTVILPGVIAFQALFRGYRTRKVLALVRDEFRLIYDEIEGENGCENAVSWGGKFGRANIRPKSSSWNKPGVLGSKRSVDNGKEKEFMDIIPSDNELERSNFGSKRKCGKKGGRLVCTQHMEEIVNNFELESKRVPAESEIRDDEFKGSSTQANSDEAQLASDLENEVIRENEVPGNRESELEPERDTPYQSMEIKDSFSDSILQPKISPEEPSERIFSRQGTSALRQDQSNKIHHEHLSTERLKSLNKNEIIQKKKELQMELLWIQQAIDSRKQYIKLKG